MSDWLERLRTVTAHDNDGGLGQDVESAVKEIDRLTTLCQEWVLDELEHQDSSLGTDSASAKGIREQIEAGGEPRTD